MLQARPHSIQMAATSTENPPQTGWDSMKLDCRIGMIRANQLHDLPWSACAPLAFASASVMYAPALVVPYHFVPWQW